MSFILAWLLAGEYLNLILGRRILWLPKRIPVPLIVLALLAVAAFTVLRNIPVYPFTILAP
jgi:NhaP-type Na+/H+ or K+/H+ antiporter